MLGDFTHGDSNYLVPRPNAKSLSPRTAALQELPLSSYVVVNSPLGELGKGQVKSIREGKRRAVSE